MPSCLYTTGRIVANFVQKSLEAQQYGNVVKHRADLQVIQNSEPQAVGGKAQHGADV